MVVVSIAGKKEVIGFSSYASEINWDSRIFLANITFHMQLLHSIHHLSESAILVVDGVGEWETTSIYGVRNRITKLSEIRVSSFFRVFVLSIHTVFRV